MRQAALVVLPRDDGKVLAISREHDVTDWGFPGGTAEPEDLTPEHTALRELWEETGVVAGVLTPVYQDGSGRYLVTTFLAEDVERWPDELRSSPWEGYVAWVSPSRLVLPTCRYRAHAAEVLRVVGLL